MRELGAGGEFNHVRGRGVAVESTHADEGRVDGVRGGGVGGLVGPAIGGGGGAARLSLVVPAFVGVGPLRVHGLGVDDLFIGGDVHGLLRVSGGQGLGGGGGGGDLGAGGLGLALPLGAGLGWRRRGGARGRLAGLQYRGVALRALGLLLVLLFLLLLLLLFLELLLALTSKLLANLASRIGMLH